MRQKSLAQRLIALAAVLAVAIGATATPALAEGTTGSITGTLTTTSGAPAAFAWVNASGPDSWRSAMTGIDGTFTFADLTPGQYRILFQASGHPTQWAYGKTSYSNATLIEVVAGQTTVVNEALLPTGTIAGRLATPSGTGVANAYVTASGSTGSYGSGMTGLDGTYRLTVLAGQYRVGFRTPSGLEQYAYGKTDYLEADLITVTADQTTTVNDSLVPTGSMSGTVVTATGSPVANAEITAEGTWSHFSTRTDSSGHYRISEVRDGDYRVAVRLASGSRMYAPQALSEREAGLYHVTVEQETTLDIQLLPTGSMVGQFTDNGTGVPNVMVSLQDDQGFTGLSGMTDATGHYEISDLFGGTYTVAFNDWNSRIRQYAYGKITSETAARVTVVPGATVTVNDTRLPTGSVRFTARNAITGEPIQAFWVSMGFEGSASNGELIMSNLPIGTYDNVWATAEGYHTIIDDPVTVTVTQGRQTEVQLSFIPVALLDVTVVDAATGAAVRDACVVPLMPRRAHAPDGCEHTDENGKVSLRLGTGKYNLMVFPPDGTSYGAQWVGASGGTGDQRNALDIKVTDGRRTTGPTVRLDRAGTISGTVTSETGQPLRFGSANLLSVHGGLGGGLGTNYGIGSDGRYTITGLGPYEWPLLFQAQGHADQWSGTNDSRFRADKIRVSSGATTTYNYELKTGTLITGSIQLRDGREVANGRVFAFAADTGDFAGEYWVWPGSPFELRVLPHSQLKLSFDEKYWYDGTSFDSSGVLPVGRPKTWLPLCVNSSTTMHFCPQH